MTAQDAVYLEYFDSNFIRGNTERIDLGYVARSGDVWFVPLYGLEFVKTSKRFRYGILALVSFLKEKDQGHITKTYETKFHELTINSIEKYSTKFQYDAPYTAYTGFVFSCISQKPIQDIFDYALDFGRSISLLQSDRFLGDNQKACIRQMWQVSIRMLHHEHMHALEVADSKSKSAQYQEVESILLKGEFMLGLFGERTLLDMPSTGEEGTYQSLTQISTYMQFRLEHFLFLIHHDYKEAQERLYYLNLVWLPPILLKAVEFSSQLPDVLYMIERATRHCIKFERNFATFETFASKAYADLDFGGSLDPDPSREMRHLALALLHCSASLLLTQLRPIDYSHEEGVQQAIDLCHLCLHPFIGKYLRLATRSLFWAGLVFSKLTHKDGFTIFSHHIDSRKTLG